MKSGCSQAWRGIHVEFDLAFTFLTSVIFYEDYDDMTPDQRLLM